MADMSAVAPEENPSPSQDDLQQGGNGAADRGTKRSRMSAAADDDDDDDDKPGRERRKIEIKFIQDKSRRHITFSKRKAGIMKKVPYPFYQSPHMRARLESSRRVFEPIAISV
jgi:pheromone receptor transcription factor